MKTLIRTFLINVLALWLTSLIMPGLYFEGGVNTLVVASIAFMLINILIVPLLKIMFLPLNLLTLGFFSWAVNVLALYFLTKMVPQIKILPYTFPGYYSNGLIIPAINLNVLYVAIISSFMIGFIAHFLQWLVKK